MTNMKNNSTQSPDVLVPVQHGGTTIYVQIRPVTVRPSS